MDLKHWTTGFRAMKTEAGLLRITTAALSVALLLALWGLVNQKPVVILEPGGWVVEDQKASQGYTEAWALFLSQTLGNVNAGNLDFVEERIGPLLPVETYEDTMTALRAQSIQFKENRVTTRFEPQKVTYEKSSGKVFVFGNYYTGTPGVKEERSKRTYEFIITMESYLPKILSIDTYEDEPRTEQVLRRMRDSEKADRIKERERARNEN